VDVITAKVKGAEKVSYKPDGRVWDTVVNFIKNRFFRIEDFK